MNYNGMDCWGWGGEGGITYREGSERWFARPVGGNPIIYSKTWDINDLIFP